MKSLLLFLLTASLGFAGSKVEDLGQHLSYLRLHAIPADLPASTQDSRHPWIVDLRFVTAQSDEARVLQAWVKFNASPASPVFLLANESTSVSLVAHFLRHPVPEVMVVAPKNANFTPDVEVVVSEKTDKKAYEAYEHGSTIASLTTDFPEKPRVDEETLAKEHIPDSQAPDVPEEDPKHPTPPPPLIDRVLQRAMHLDQGLLALRKG